MFLDKRVYQGSRGSVYPNPFTDRLCDTKLDKAYQVVILENEYVRLMILPEIGGRIHVGQDKTNGYDFFYRQNVIKPALVGLLGPWISGGLEFNSPQHHRPSTFMPVEFQIEELEDGSCTVWLSEHEPMNRMKGMVGICLYPGKSIVETKVRLYNRTPLPQTFLWWENAGLHVHDQYQAFFPPDVTFVVDHAKRAVSRFPVARNFYYGVDYTAGVDITWYKNIPVPTSYMVTKSDYDFFGGYDHAKKAGIVHVANRRISPGKKLWTWGNAEFGYAWDRELTDSDGPSIELMAGVFTDNQPDFSWLQPYETKAFRQYWYPIQEIGPVKNANRLLAVNLERRGDEWQVGICTTEALDQVRVILLHADDTVADREVSIRPGNPYLDSLYIAGVARDSDLLVRVLDSAGRELIRYRPEERRGTELPEPASEPAPPENMASADELYITGLHLEQYRHATRHPEFYWIEALRRDPSDARCNNAMGLLLLRRGEAAAAEKHFQKAIARLTRRNPNPYDGEPYYHLGLALKAQGRVDEAYAVFYKAVWVYAWKSAANYELALLDCRRSDFGLALEHLMESLAVDSGHLKARDLKTAILRKLERRDEAQAVARDTLRMDRLDFWANHEMDLIEGSLTAPRVMRGEPQNFLDLAYDYADAGFWQEAIEILLACPKVHPMVFYSLGHWAEQSGDARAAARYRHLGLEVPPDYCFPARLDELRVLESALAANPRDARAHYYLGNLLYDKGRREEAIEHWDKACEAAPGFSIPWRNLGIAYFNVRRDALRALACYERARAAAPADARLLYEYDQLRKRMGASPSERLAELERSHSLLEQHDGLTIELVSLYNQTGNPERALSILVSRRFHPWEGGEGLASEQYVLSRILLGREALDRGDAGTALEHFEAARVYPHSLGEGKPLLIEEGHVDYFAGQAHSSLGNETEAHRCWERAAAPANGFNLFTYFRALASRKLGRENEAQKLLSDLRAFAELQLKAEVKVDYFATSLPNFLLFEDDLQKCKQVECLFLRGRANQGSGRTAAAAEDYRQVLELDRSHFWAEEALRELDVGWEQDVARA
jgi:tetratricopeptide (TPR) repeat protein